MANIALVNSNNKVRLNEIVENIGQPIATFEGHGLDSTVLAISGLNFPYGKLEEIKNKIDDNKDVIKRNLTATSERRLTGSIDFLGDVTSEKPKTGKKKSTRDMLFM